MARQRVAAATAPHTVEYRANGPTGHRTARTAYTQCAFLSHASAAPNNFTRRAAHVTHAPPSCVRHSCRARSWAVGGAAARRASRENPGRVANRVEGGDCAASYVCGPAPPGPGSHTCACARHVHARESRGSARIHSRGRVATRGAFGGRTRESNFVEFRGRVGGARERERTRRVRLPRDWLHVTVLGALDGERRQWGNFTGEARSKRGFCSHAPPWVQSPCLSSAEFEEAEKPSARVYAARAAELALERAWMHSQCLHHRTRMTLCARSFARRTDVRFGKPGTASDTRLRRSGLASNAHARPLVPPVRAPPTRSRSVTGDGRRAGGVGRRPGRGGRGAQRRRRGRDAGGAVRTRHAAGQSIHMRARELLFASAAHSALPARTSPARPPRSGECA